MPSHALSHVNLFTALGRVLQQAFIQKVVINQNLRISNRRKPAQRDKVVRAAARAHQRNLAHFLFRALALTCIKRHTRICLRRVRNPVFRHTKLRHFPEETRPFPILRDSLFGRAAQIGKIIHYFLRPPGKLRRNPASQQGGRAGACSLRTDTDCQFSFLYQRRKQKAAVLLLVHGVDKDSPLPAEHTDTVV